HHERAQAPERAAPWWAKAATQALEANDFTGAIARAEAAERCGARGDDLAEALLARAEAHSWLGDNPALRETAGRLGAVATSPVHAAEALRWRALGALRAGDVGDLVRTLDRVRSIATQHLDHDSVVFCSFRTATYALPAGLVAQADALAAQLEAAEPPLERRSGRLLVARAFWRGRRAHSAHDDEHALHLRREAARFLRSTGDVRNAALEEANSGFLLLMLGAYEEASQVLEASLAECRRLGLSSGLATNQHNLGLVLLGLGRLDHAMAVEREAVAAFVAGGNTLMESASRGYMARILVASGRSCEAAAEAEHALGLLPPAHPIALVARAALADALLL
ncbi:MAG: tetratricopeptide repeat protein, partial [Deltaproteobacteria bacterium]